MPDSNRKLRAIESAITAADRVAQRVEDCIESMSGALIASGVLMRSNAEKAYLVLERDANEIPAVRELIAELAAHARQIRVLRMILT